MLHRHFDDWTLISAVKCLHLDYNQGFPLAASILAQHGSEPIGAYSLLPDKRFLFDSTASLWFLAFRDIGKSRVILGGPIGANDTAGPAMKAAHSDARQRGKRLIYYQVPRSIALMPEAESYSRVYIGSDASIDLARFTLRGNAYQDLRSARNRMNKNQIVFCEITSGNVSPDDKRQLAEISAQWLRARKARELQFSMGKFDEVVHILKYNRIFTARSVSTRRLIGFVTFVPIFDGKRHGRPSGYGLDLMRSSSEIPGTVEFLITEALLLFRDEGCVRASLGMSALANLEEESGQLKQNGGLDRVLRLAFSRCNMLYSFKGLSEFKRKFQPEWLPRYMLYQGKRGLVPSTYALFRAHTQATVPK